MKDWYQACTAVCWLLIKPWICERSCYWNELAKSNPSVIFFQALVLQCYFIVQKWYCTSCRKSVRESRREKKKKSAETESTLSCRQHSNLSSFFFRLFSLFYASFPTLVQPANTAMCSEEIICLLVDLSNLVKFLFAFRLAFPASISIYVETRGKAEGTREKCVMLETIAECFSFFRWLKCRGGATEWVTGEGCIYLPLTILINALWHAFATVQRVRCIMQIIGRNTNQKVCWKVLKESQLNVMGLQYTNRQRVRAYTTRHYSA